MIFCHRVDEEIRLCLVNRSFAADYETLARVNSDYLAQWLAWPGTCVTRQDFEAFVATSLRNYANNESMTCALEYKGAIVGNVSFNSIDQQLRKVEIGYWIGEASQGKGIVTRACRYLIAFAFEQMAMDVVQVSVAKENKTSRAVCERLGMTLEGVIPNSEVIGGRILDHAIYTIRSNGV